MTSLEENTELFRMALAGFGLFGVMTKVRLRLVPSREWVTMHSLTFDTLEEASGRVLRRSARPITLTAVPIR